LNIEYLNIVFEYCLMTQIVYGRYGIMLVV